MGTIFFTKIFSMGITASILLNILTDLSTGAISGLVSGLVVGAIIVPLLQVPDALGRALLIGAIFALLMAGFQIVKVLAVTGGSMGAILNASDDASVGPVIINAVIYVLYALLAGALIGVFITVPDRALKGGLVGMLFGAVIGAVLYWAFVNWGINMNLTIFRLLTGFLTFGVLTAVVGKD